MCHVNQILENIKYFTTFFYCLSLISFIFYDPNKVLLLIPLKKEKKKRKDIRM